MSQDTTHHEKAIEGIVRIPAIVTLGLIGLSGCVSLPAPEPASPEITPGELSGHVEFLSQYALQGRTPRSRGSATARRYITRQFGACGLVPWGQARGFEQPFTLGTNVIGALPGSDPNLSREFVILSAHYDHKGWTGKGLCRGACDNASGVAALLEIAEQLASSPQRPRRSVCLAAFDCEEAMLLGAMAFTCRLDYDPNQIAAVVNLDMLGRDGFEVLERHLFVVGTENYPGKGVRLLI